MTSNNLIRAFQSNHNDLLHLAGQQTFDINELMRLITVRGQIVEEIITSDIAAQCSEVLKNKQNELQEALSQARDNNGQRLSKLLAGRKALKAYRGGRDLLT